tara:strand:+ start:174 stop:377 length:204 start_codon:yes stop_codon:yes gene_type:complete
MSASVMQTMPGDKGKPLNMTTEMPTTTQPGDKGLESKKKKKNGSILTSLIGTTETSEISNPSLMGGY